MSKANENEKIIGESKVYKQYWLAEAISIADDGTVFDLRLTDGSHSNPKGVKEAEQIIKRLRLGNPNRKFVMVTIEEVPDTKVKLNEKAIKSIQTMQETV